MIPALELQPKKQSKAARIKISVGQRDYEFFGAAAKIFRDRSRYVFICGGTGTGKTLPVLVKAYSIACKYPGCRILLCGKTRVDLSESVLATFEGEVLPGNLPKDILNIHLPKRANRSKYTLPNGSEFLICGLNDSERLRSSQYDLACIFEATQTTERDFNLISSRLRNNVVPYQQMLLDSNPSYPTHYLNQLSISGRVKQYKSFHKDNPKMTPEYLEALNQLRGQERDRFYLGLWVGSSGVVYPEFSELTHVVDDLQIPDEWRRFRSIDFGTVAPFVCLWAAVSPDKRVYIYRELYYSNRRVADNVHRINELTGIEHIEATISDHDPAIREALVAEGISTVPAKKNVVQGIQTVASALRPDQNGEIGLYIVRNSLVERDAALRNSGKPTCLIEEFRTYSYAEAGDGRTIKDLPRKEHDHACDALRYLMMFIHAGVRPSIFSLSAPTEQCKPKTQMILDQEERERKIYLWNNPRIWR